LPALCIRSESACVNVMSQIALFLQTPGAQSDAVAATVQWQCGNRAAFGVRSNVKIEQMIRISNAIHALANGLRSKITPHRCLDLKWRLASVD